MSLRPIKKGSTDQSVVIRIIDSTDGTPENAVVYNTAGIDLWWRREGEVKTSITEATLATLDAAHSDGGILLIGDGYYRLDLPDAAVAAGAGENGVMVGGTVTGMIVIGCYVPLVDYDPYDVADLGLTILSDWADGGRLDLLLDAIPTTAMRGTDSAALASGVDITHIMGTILTEGVAGRLAAAFIKLLDVATPLLVASDVMRGTDGANTTVPDAAGTAPTAIEIQTEMEENGASLLDTIRDQIGAAGAGLTALGDARVANLDAAVTTRATPAQVNEQVLDVMTVDTHGEPAQGVPPATASIFTKLNHLYKAWRNKRTTDNAGVSYYNDAGAVIDHKRTHADNGALYTKDEIVSGP